MKSSLIVDDLTLGQGAEPAGSSFARHLAAIVASLRRAREDSRMRAALAELDAAMLRDIGIADDEIHRIRARETFTPRSWRD